MADARGAARPWTLLSGHGHVLVAIGKSPAARVRDLAADAGLTERSTQAIITDLEATGYISRHRVGRRTEYTIHTNRPFPDHGLDGVEIGSFLELLAGYPARGGRQYAETHKTPGPRSLSGVRSDPSCDVSGPS